LIQSDPNLVSKIVAGNVHCSEVDLLVYNVGNWFVDVPSYLGPAKYGVEFSTDCKMCLIDRKLDVTPLARGDTLRLYPAMLYGYKINLNRYYKLSGEKFRLWALLSVKNLSRGKDVIHVATDTIECVGN